jgi:hypothetical protein
MTATSAIKKYAIHAALLIFVIVWIAYKLEVGIFSPKPPSSLPKNAIWINAPLVPFAFAHGWWLGCEMQGATDVCTLVGHNDRFNGGDGKNSLVSNGTYLSCTSMKPLETSEIALRQPPSSANMWIIHDDATSKSFDMAPAAFLRNGDVLVPTDAIVQCPKFLNANSEVDKPR